MNFSLAPLAADNLFTNMTLLSNSIKNLGLRKLVFYPTEAKLTKI
jgi:hypothetical protein